MLRGSDLHSGCLLKCVRVCVCVCVCVCVYVVCLHAASK